MDDGNEDYDPESVSFEKMDKAKKKRKRSRLHDEPQFSDEDDEGIHREIQIERHFYFSHFWRPYILAKYPRTGGPIPTKKHAPITSAASGGFTDELAKLAQGCNTIEKML